MPRSTIFQTRNPLPAAESEAIVTHTSPQPRSLLLQLPDELLEQIAGHFTLADLTSFRSTSTRLHLATSRLFGQTYLRDLHVSMVNTDQQRVRTMLQHSLHNPWQTCKLTKVFIRVWPFLSNCPESCDISHHTGSTRRVLCSNRFLLHLKDMRDLFAGLPDSVKTIALVPWRPSEEQRIWSDWQPRCEYLHIFQVALRQSGAQIPNVVLYSDEKPIREYEVMANHLSCLLIDKWARYWPEKQIQPFMPGDLEETDGTAMEAGAGTSLTIHGRSDLTQLQRPAVPLYLSHLQLLTFTSGRMIYSDIFTILRTHKNTLRKILFHNVVLGQLGYKRVFNEMTRAEEEGEEEYPRLTHFEIVNAWERDFDQILDLQVSARKVVFGPGDGVANAVGKVVGEPGEMRGKIEGLRDSVRYLTSAQALRGLDATV